MTFLQNIKAVFSKLGLVDKAKEKTLTAADWNAIRTAYKEEFGTELDDDRTAYEEQQSSARAAAQLQATQDAILNIVNSVVLEGNETEGSDDEGQGGVDSSGLDSGVASATGTSRSDQQVLAGVQTMADMLHRMAGQVIPDNPPSVGGSALAVNGPGTTAQYFCGIPHQMFAMSHRYNQIAVNPGYATLNPVDEDSHGKPFREGLRAYAKTLSERMGELRQANALNPKTLSEGISIGIDPKGLGDQYLIRRSDALIARLLEIRNVYDIFPRQFGIQDRAVMVNAFFEDFSQGYQEGEVWKGGVALAPEFCYVDDAMFKTRFGSMKNLERQYIGYLNKEGSDPVKWTMIEWAILNISTKLILEQNERRILGIYTQPEKDKPGHILNAGTGVYYTLLRYYNEGKLTLVDESAFASYSSGSTMVACVVNMLLELSKYVPDLSSFEVILNENHKAMWKQGLRAVYGKDTDFTGPTGDKVPDFDNVIRWCPYWSTIPIILLQKPGNIQALEFEAGEMHNIKFETHMEAVLSWSTWKEGTSATYSGRQFATKGDRKAHGFADQEIFMNRPSVSVDPDATTITAQGDFRHYITSANTAATTITDISGAKLGFAYLIEVGDATNASKIAKSGKFADISAAYTPTKVGDYLMVAINSTGDKFIELERCVGGVRTINKDVQPNVPGGR